MYANPNERKYVWRTNLYDNVGESLGESTRSGAMDPSVEFTQEMLRTGHGQLNTQV